MRSRRHGGVGARRGGRRSRTPYRHEQRTLARREAVQVLYISELTGEGVGSLVDGSASTGLFVVPEVPAGASDNDLIGVPLAPYASELLRGIEGHLGEIDSQIADVALNWPLERMPAVDRNIIRLAAYEIAYRGDVPTGVAIDEAVELAKVFGTDNSPKFVNGVLGRIAENMENMEGAGDSGDSGSLEGPGDSEGPGSSARTEGEGDE